MFTSSNNYCIVVPSVFTFLATTWHGFYSEHFVTFFSSIHYLIVIHEGKFTTNIKTKHHWYYFLYWRRESMGILVVWLNKYCNLCRFIRCALLDPRPQVFSFYLWNFYLSYTTTSRTSLRYEQVSKKKKKYFPTSETFLIHWRCLKVWTHRLSKSSELI